MAQDRSMTGRIVHFLLFNPVTKGAALGGSLFAAGWAGYHIGNFLDDQKTPDCGSDFTIVSSGENADTVVGGELRLKDGTTCKLIYEP